MKRSITTIFRNACMVGALFMFCSITSCGKSEVDPETDDTEQTGTFKIDGVEYKGKTSVQTFTNGNYSILCENDSPYKFIQITFHSKAEAEKGGTFKAEDYKMDIPSGSANVGIDGNTYNPDGNSVIIVSGKKITLSTLKLNQTGGGTKTATIQSAAISF
ncbi:hypothetical protein [Dyadobacter soli]|nr:hypothetical protein [Dyadobacter soli]